MRKILIMLLTLLMLCACASKTEETIVEEKYADKYIELHAHIDGSITVDIARKLAELQNVDLPADDGELEELLQVSKDCKDLNEFLEKFDLPVSLMQTYEGLEEAAYLVCEDMYEDGVIYAELRYAPQLHCTQGMNQEDAINAVIDGCNRSRLKANVILCFMRGEGNEAQNFETLELAKKYLVKDGGVVAVDIAGAEGLYPTSNYAEIFAQAKQMGVPFTIHAGEADGASSVKDAVEFGAVRIGHGVRSREDEKVLDMLVEKGITLEMCPSSNIVTGAVDDINNEPIIDYMNRGIKVTLNTDDLGVVGTTLSNEYRLMEEVFGLTPAQEKVLLANAIDAAFTTEEVKADLRNQLGIN